MDGMGRGIKMKVVCASARKWWLKAAAVQENPIVQAELLYRMLEPERKRSVSRIVKDALGWGVRR